MVMCIVVIIKRLMFISEGFGSLNNSNIRQIFQPGKPPNKQTRRWVFFN